MATKKKLNPVHRKMLADFKRSSGNTLLGVVRKELEKAKLMGLQIQDGEKTCGRKSIWLSIPICRGKYKAVKAYVHCYRRNYRHFGDPPGDFGWYVHFYLIKRSKKGVEEEREPLVLDLNYSDLGRGTYFYNKQDAIAFASYSLKYHANFLIQQKIKYIKKDLKYDEDYFAKKRQRMLVKRRKVKSLEAVQRLLSKFKKEKGG